VPDDAGTPGAAGSPGTPHDKEVDRG